jgi:hypothetical protein
VSLAVAGASTYARLASPAVKRRSKFVDPITAALAAGAAAGLANVAAQAVKDAYGQLTAALNARFPELGVHVQALEARPDSQLKQSSLAEELVEAGAEHDAELLQLAQALLAVIEREAPEAAERAGVDLERVKAGGSLEIKDADGDDVGVRGRDWEVKGDIRISGARGGAGSDPKSLRAASAAQPDPAPHASREPVRRYRRTIGASIHFDDLVDAALTHVTPGRFAFDPPVEMRQGKAERVSVALIRAEGLDDALRAHLRASVEFIDVPTSPLMAVQLRGDAAFAIAALSELEQPVGRMEATTWEFDVRGEQPGRHALTAIVTLRLPLTGRDDLRRSVPVLERTVRIRVAPLYAGGLFLQDNWKWLIATAIAVGGLGGGVAAWQKLLP